MTALCVCGHPRSAHVGGQGRCGQQITVLDVVDVPCACASWAPAAALPDLATEDGPAAVLAALGAVWSDDFDAYASGELDASRLHCALCQCAPCRCPAFGTDAYFALLDQRHGRPRAQCAQCGRPITRTAPGAPWTAADTLPAAGCAHVPAGAL